MSLIWAQVALCKLTNDGCRIYIFTIAMGARAVDEGEWKIWY